MANIVVVIIVYVGTTCINSEPNFASTSPDLFTYTASSEPGDLFMDSITNLVKSEGKERQCVFVYFNTIFQLSFNRHKSC